MSREIKFRAWDGKRMIFPSVIGLNIEDFAWGHDRSWLHNCQEWDGEEGFIDAPDLMQYTGLKDKNGKEIYEKDVIEYDGMLYIVTWHEGAASFYFEPVDNNCDASDFSEVPLNIIQLKGNIYENPELLKP